MARDSTRSVRGQDSSAVKESVGIKQVREHIWLVM